MRQPLWAKIVSTLLPPAILAGMIIFPHPFAFFVCIGIWIMYLASTSILYKASVYTLVTEIMTMCSCIILLLMVESEIFRWFFVAVSFVLFFFLTWMSSEYTGWLVHIKEKPLRRMRMMIHVFNVYAWFIGVFAVSVYFQFFPFAVLAILGGAYAFLGTMLIWRLYFKLLKKELILPCAILTLAVIQLLGVMQLMPFGYLAQGFLVVWLWYLGQLFMRFKLGPNGIVWSKQIAFIVINIILFVLVLSSVRWI